MPTHRVNRNSEIELEHVLARTFERLDASFRAHEQRMLSIVEKITSKFDNGEYYPMMSSTDANDVSQLEKPSLVLEGSCLGDDAITTSKSNEDVLAANVGSQSDKPSPILEGYCSDDDADALHPSSTFQLESARSNSTLKLDSKKPWLIRFVKSPFFRKLVAVVIICNAIVVGWEVDELGRSIVDTSTEVSFFFRWAFYFFTCMFALELMLRIVAFRYSFFVPGDLGDQFWNVFDTLVVGCSITSLIFELYPVGTRLSSLDVVSTFRLFRIFRLLRVLRVIRLLGVCPGLRVLAVTVVEALKQSGHLFMLLVLVLYVFAVVFVHLSLDKLAASDLYKTHQEVEEQELWKLFGTLPRGMETLFQSICGGRDWYDFSLELSNVGPATVAIFHVYISAVAIVLMNVITGLFCQSACAAALTDHNQVLQMKLKEQQTGIKNLRKTFETLDQLSDVSPDGAFTLEELRDGMSDPTVKALFATLEIDFDDAWTLFKLLDKKQQGYIDIDLFLEGCKKCRGNARAIDTQLLRYELKKLKKLVGSMSMNMARGVTPLTILSI